jgi:lysozyme
MTAIDTAKSIAKPFEGWSEKVYICPAGYPTIGYGHRCDRTHAPITKEQGEAYLSADMAKALRGAIKYCPILLDSPEKLGAIADFCYNLGVGRLQTSTLRRRINQRNWNEAQKELMRWVRGGGRILKGLVLRRGVESRYFRC